MKSANRSGASVAASRPAARLLLQAVDDRLGVDLLLDVDRRRIDHEVRPVLRVLAAPDELRVTQLDLAGFLQLLALRVRQADAHALPHDLRVEVGIARAGLSVRQRRRARIARRRHRRVFLHALRDGLEFGGRDVAARVGVNQHFDRLCDPLAASEGAAFWFLGSGRLQRRLEKLISRANAASISNTSMNSANAQRPKRPRLLTPGTHSLRIVSAFSLASVLRKPLISTTRLSGSSVPIIHPHDVVGPVAALLDPVAIGHLELHALVLHVGEHARMGFGRPRELRLPVAVQHHVVHVAPRPVPVV